MKKYKQINAGKCSWCGYKYSATPVDNTEECRQFRVYCPCGCESKMVTVLADEIHTVILG